MESLERVSCVGTFIHGRVVELWMKLFAMPLGQQWCDIKSCRAPCECVGRGHFQFSESVQSFSHGLESIYRVYLPVPASTYDRKKREWGDK